MRFDFSPERHFLDRLQQRAYVRPCRSWSCRSANPYHDSHLTLLGRLRYAWRG